MISVVMTLAVEVMTTGVLWCLDFVLLFLVEVVSVVGVGELVLMVVVVREDVGVLVVEDEGCVELAVQLVLKIYIEFEEVAEVAGVELEDLVLLLGSDELLWMEVLTLVGVELLLDWVELDWVEDLVLVGTLPD